VTSSNFKPAEDPPDPHLVRGELELAGPQPAPAQVLVGPAGEVADGHVILRD
jgi:hypothetical protein